MGTTRPICRTDPLTDDLGLGGKSSFLSCGSGVAETAYTSVLLMHPSTVTSACQEELAQILLTCRVGQDHFSRVTVGRAQTTTSSLYPLERFAQEMPGGKSDTTLT